MRDFTRFVWVVLILLLSLFVLIELIKIVFNISDETLDIGGVIFIFAAVIYTSLV